MGDCRKTELPMNECIKDCSHDKIMNENFFFIDVYILNERVLLVNKLC